MLISVWKCIINTRIVYLLHVSATYLAMLREVRCKGWIPRGMTRVCEPVASALLCFDGDVLSTYIIHHTLQLVTKMFKSVF